MLARKQKEIIRKIGYENKEIEQACEEVKIKKQTLYEWLLENKEFERELYKILEINFKLNRHMAMIELGVGIKTLREISKKEGSDNVRVMASKALISVALGSTDLVKENDNGVILDIIKDIRDKEKYREIELEEY